MSSGTKIIELHIGGMTCINCEQRITQRLRNTAGIVNVQVSYSVGNATVAYDPQKVSYKRIVSGIESLGYNVLPDAPPAFGAPRIVGLALIVVALYSIIQHFGVLNLLVPGELANSNMEYGMLFVIGLITSVHCLAMCGGINLSQSVAGSVQGFRESGDTVAAERGDDARSKARGKARGGSANSSAGARGGFVGSRLSALKPTLLYNLGRVLSYTLIGFIVGGLGSVLVFSSVLQGMLKLFAGVFMVLMGLNMLGVLPWLRKITPRLPRTWAAKASALKLGGKSPLFVGLLNGLMPCGPLQAMQLYALATANPFAGALAMLLYSLGTVPLMLGLGALCSALGKKFAKKVVTAGAVLVVVLGMSMFTQGWSLSGVSLPMPFESMRYGTDANSNVADTQGQAIVEGGVQLVNSTLTSGRYPNITVQAGMPVKWTIDAPQGSVNGCNNRMILREYGVEHAFKTGENVIEFVPEKVGVIRYSCWMGMIRGTVNVV